MKIAAYTICLNEEKHVARWLEANKEADYRVILDTGSTDNTISLLHEAQKTDPHLIVHETKIVPWRFDDARNAALALAPTDVDVCLSVDMDEIPDEGFFKTVREEWKRETTRGWFPFDTGSVWQCNRLHSRFGYRWISPCHEVAVKYGTEPEVSQNFTVGMSHRPDNDKSRGQYLDLLVMAVNEKPEDGRMWTYLAREYYFHSNWAKVLEASSVAVALEDTWNVEKAYACRLAALAAQQHGHNPEALLLEGIKHDSESLESWYPLAHFYFLEKRWQECWDAASKRLTTKQTTHYLRENSVWDWKMYDLMGLAKWHLGDKESALKWSEIALKGDPENERLIKNLEFIKNESA